ncbi:MAG: glutamine-hydrolyzing GMP synthase [Candidatus Izemoplasmataceae bacterium]
MEKILVMDFGSQYNQLIARRIRELHIYTEVVPHTVTLEELDLSNVIGIVLSGGPSSVYDSDAPSIDERILDLDIPILGICYGMQLVMKHYGGVVEESLKREYGKSDLTLLEEDVILQDMSKTSTVWMSHGDHVVALPSDFVLLGKTPSSMAMTRHQEKNIYTVQFHPEVTHTDEGRIFLKNFALDVCKAKCDWYLEDFIEDSVKRIKDLVKDDKVILGLSGGVDSSVAALLLHKAIGDQLVCIFVDTGLLRHEEAVEVIDNYMELHDLNIVKVDAEDLFFDSLKGVDDPEEKRKIIGKHFFDVFEEAKAKNSDARFLAQGTIYPDVIESISIHGPSKTIKSHHNVGGVPSKHSFEILEPLKELFKDEVRELGMKLGLPKHLVDRHPFPGPGLGIRVIGEVDKEKVAILQKADRIFIEELRSHQLYNEVSQAFVTLLTVKTVGVMGDNRTYEYVCALRSVNTTDFMTAHVSRFDFDFLEKVAGRIVSEVKGINRVVYDITSKPPGTIEWE